MLRNRLLSGSYYRLISLYSLLALLVFLQSALAFSCGQVSQGRGEDAGNVLTENIRDLHRQLHLARHVCFKMFGFLSTLNFYVSKMKFCL